MTGNQERIFHMLESWFKDWLRTKHHSHQGWNLFTVTLCYYGR